MTAESADDKNVKHMMDTLALSQRLNFPGGTYPTTAVQKVSQYTCTAQKVQYDKSGVVDRDIIRVFL
jgi:hypothetical protein